MQMNVTRTSYKMLMWIPSPAPSLVTVSPVRVPRLVPLPCAFRGRRALLGRGCGCALCGSLVCQKTINDIKAAPSQFPLGAPPTARNRSSLACLGTRSMMATLALSSATAAACRLPGGGGGGTRRHHRRLDSSSFRRAAATADVVNNNCRRGLARAAASRPDDSSTAEEGSDPLVDNVERASQLLDLIIKETLEQIFVEEVVDENFEEIVPGDGDEPQTKRVPVPGVDREAVLRSVVLNHLEDFDGSFMAAISAYVQVAESSGDFGLLTLLAAIREEVLAAVSGELQPEIQVVQLVARLASKEDRLEVLRAAHR